MARNGEEIGVLFKAFRKGGDCSVFNKDLQIFILGLTKRTRGKPEEASITARRGAATARGIVRPN